MQMDIRPRTGARAPEIRVQNAPPGPPLQNLVLPTPHPTLCIVPIHPPQHKWKDKTIHSGNASLNTLTRQRARCW